MNNELMPFQNIISSIKEEGCIENLYISQTIEGFRKLELQILHSNNSRSFYVITDNRLTIDKRQITIIPFNNMQQRNQEIKRLYLEEKMTQVFIAKIFRLAQSTISGIVNSKDPKVIMTRG
ncbi:hypothetical protein DVV95_11160 [Clostridium botulinum]|uniref:hypothetical protein n=1 Tax=Clostridium botulinum TaxID=1491 RepID=UPI000A16FB81|nr:hypothetical protein [Clostridium botulinum]MBN1062372.1 hypothetical protein [Clostridium botulinum]